MGRERALRRGLRLELATIAYNLLEGAVSIGAGFAAGSVSLIGFGIDSAIETTSGAAVLWRLSRDESARRERTEFATRRIIGWCFIALALYVAWEAAESILARKAPARSFAGIAICAVSVLIMPWLAAAKRRVAAELESGAVRADARQTDFCFYLSVIVLAGLTLNALFGWWWADPAAAMFIVPIIAKEGYNGILGKSCNGACGCSARGAGI